LVSASHLEAEHFLGQIKETQTQAAEAHAQAEQASAQARETAEELRARLAGIDAEREAILSAAREQAAQELAAVRQELRAVQRKLAIMSTAPAAVSRVESDLDALAEELAPVEPAPRERLPAETTAAPAGAAQIEVGDTVWVSDLNATGELLDLDGDAAEVQVGAFRVRARRASLQLRHKAAAPASDTPEREIAVPAAPPVSVELHLRGLRVDQAIPKLERYLDEAYRAQTPFVRIVHGKGTGALRKAVREFLSGYPLVGSFRSGEQGEGGTGVTVVKFDNA
jgi:DNA mismatch repair protein MutS2